MDLFWLDKEILNFFTNFNYYQLFLISTGGLIGTFLWSGAFINKNRGNRK